MARQAATTPPDRLSTRVELAINYRGPDGVQHKADDTVDLPTLVALELISLGHARRPAESTHVAAKKTITEA